MPLKQKITLEVNNLKYCTSKVNVLNGLSQSNSYGVRVEDKDISLNVPDVVKILAVYESKTNSTPVLDKVNLYRD